MPGVRILATDPALAGKTIEIEHHARRSAHGPKVYRLRLDAAAGVIVSPVVWDRLCEVMAAVPACPRFYAVDDVARPPRQVLAGRSAPADVIRFSAAAGTRRAGVVSLPDITLR